MELSTKYSPQNIEDKWYQYWLEKGFFHSEPDSREPYTIVIPPPNVTGVLHMGHMLNNTLQDVLARRQRMLGKNVCWVPGTDHASIATEAKVVNKLAQEGIAKTDLSREQFLEHAWEWTHKHGGIILEQLKKLGASCDWKRTKFTMDDALSESVIKVFVDLHSKGLIYRGVRMVNWDPKAQTAVSDEEVEYKELQSKLYYLRYKIVGSENESIIIATTRPETILGDTAVCVNPADERYKHLKGKQVYVPLLNRAIPIIEDSYVEMEFGTGCLKITPAHDINDYEIGIRHNLPSIDIFNPDGTLSEAAQLYVGVERFEVRKQIVQQLQKEGFVEKIEDYNNKVGYSQRTNEVIEPRLSMQWFLKMEKITKPALDNVMNNNIRFHPEKMKNSYRHWMENVRDWCISRQLWWGQRIPAFYLPDSNEFVVAETPEKALELAKQKTNNKNLTINDLRQDEDVLDTWFSSWLWPISVFDGIRSPENPEVNYYYPTNDLVTAHDIMFFWVARMIMSGYEYRKDLPFKNVYFTSMVRDGLGRKMSKSLGNSPDPLDLIKDYGADGVRVGMLLCAVAGSDLLFDIKKDEKTGETGYPLPEQGRNFANKIWNAYRLINSWNARVSTEGEMPEADQRAIEWFEHKLNESMQTLENHFDSYRISEALMTVYRLFWDDFSSWYLELVKPAYEKQIFKATYEKTVSFFERLMQLLHPFMPFITEEIWQTIQPRKDGESLMMSLLPKVQTFDKDLLERFDFAKEVITNVRSVRANRNIPQRDALELCVKTNGKYDSYFDTLLQKAANIQQVKVVEDKVEGAVSFLVKNTEYYIPLGSDKINVAEELAKLEADLKYQQGFLMSVDKKLSNERFVQNASAEIVDKERAKKFDAEQKIKTLFEQIQSLKAL